MGTFLLVAFILYFVPSIVAFARHKRNKGAIFSLNLFLGFTVIGWVAALVWALTHDDIVVITK